MLLLLHHQKNKQTNMKKILLSIVATTLIGVSMQAQTNEPKGKTVVQVFGNFHSELAEEKPKPAFGLERTYLGYEGKLSESLSMQAVMDIGKSSDVGDMHYMAYIKKAEISWKKGDFTFKGGMISTTQFNFQEKFWGHRYVMKSFQDQYKFGSSADLGLAAYYNPTSWLTMDLIIVNGEGYKKVQSNEGFNYGIGATLTPLKGFQIRLYSGLNQGNGIDKKDALNLAAFMGYKGKEFSIGAEYNHKMNTLETNSYNQSGLSLYMSYILNKHINLYARYDELSSTDDWYSKDESSAILGAEFKLSKNIKISPNLRLSMPKAQEQDNTYSAYINCSFGL